MFNLTNVPDVTIGLVGVSRDCFVLELTKRRLNKLHDACYAEHVHVRSLTTIIENEVDVLKVLDEAKAFGINALVIFLGNFGPEGPATILAQMFDGPVMFCAAAEETGDDLINGRGDALCGLLNTSYNLGLRNIKAHIPQNPVGLPKELAVEIALFQNIARVILGLKSLKIFSFGPRPQDFFACNAPIKPLFDLGIEVMENSELDLLVLYNEIADDDPAIAPIVEEMTKELGEGNTYPDLLLKLARFEIALLKFLEANLGSRKYGIFANKCWPAFEKMFGFVPCYVNSRLAAMGIPVACEVDLYGALSQYMCYLATLEPATLLDINNSVPNDMFNKCRTESENDSTVPSDLFMGFHCGNTPACCMKNCSMKYQLIMNRLMEDSTKEPDITRGTLEGQIMPGPTTMFRLQGTAEGQIKSYIAQGAILDVDPHSFGGIGIFNVEDFGRFYRQVLIGKRFPHHAAVAFGHTGAVLHDALTLLGVENISYPLNKYEIYPNENPFGI